MKQSNLNDKKAFRFKRFARKAYSAFNSMHKVVSIGVLSAFTLFFLQTAETSAQTKESTHQTNVEGNELEEVTVTASRAGSTLEQAAKIVRVITRTEIEQSPAKSVQDLLKSISGIDVRQRGPNGIQSDISLRGGTPDQIVILLNGANLTNPQTGHYNFDIPINLSDIERIEIIQGPSALIYGSGAFAGGINIITHKKADTKANFSLEAGMHKLWDAEAGGALTAGDFSHRLSAGIASSEGYTEDSDYQIFNSLWQSHMQQGKNSIDFLFGINDKKYGANTFYSPKYPHQYDHTSSLFSSLRGETGEKIKMIPLIYWSRHYDTFDLVRGGSPNIPTNHHRSDIYGFILDMQYTSRIGTTHIGGEFRNEGIASNVLGVVTDSLSPKYPKSDNRSNIGYFIEQNVLYQKFNLSAGFLANYNTSLNEGFRVYPSVNASYRLIQSLRVYASWSQSMRMPTFTDLYYKTATHKGNPDLLPEQSESFELGIRFKNRFFSAHANTFYMSGKNIIDWVRKSPAADALWESLNYTRLDKTGFETFADIHLKEIFSGFPGGTRLVASYTYLQQTKGAADSNDGYTFDSNYALDYLKHKITAQLDHPIWKGLSAFWEFRWQDRQGSYDLFENAVMTGKESYRPYSVLDLKINWKWKNFNYYAHFYNLFNNQYVDLGNIPQPGLWLTAGISYSH